MLFPNYIKKNHIILFIIVEILLMLSGLILLAKFCVIGFAVALFLFRLGEISGPSTMIEHEGQSGIYAPVGGKIIDISVRGQETQVLFQMPWHLSYTVRAPIKADVEDIKVFSKGSGIFRFSKIDDFYRESFPGSIAIRFIVGHHGLHSAGEASSDCHYDRLTLKLIECVFGLFPDVWVRQGDRCHMQAAIGVIPFGGTVSLSLPLNYEIITKVGDMVTAGSSRIANIK